MSSNTHNQASIPEAKIDWNEVTNQFNSLPIGGLCKGNNGEYYIKPQQSKAHHLDDLLINLFTGKPEHYSNTYGLHQVSGNSLCW